MSVRPRSRTLAGTTLFTCGVLVVNHVSNFVFDRIANRLPNAMDVAVFSLAFVALQPALCVNLYVRAHKRDPFLLVAIISSGTVAILVTWLGLKYSTFGTGIGYLAGIAMVQTPLILTVWWKTRREWH